MAAERLQLQLLLLQALPLTAVTIVGRPATALSGSARSSSRSSLHTLRACASSGASSDPPGVCPPDVPNTFRVPEGFVQKPVQLPRIGVGTQSWGDPQRGWGLNFNATDIEEAFDTLTSGGIHFFDTSEVYGYQNQRLCEGSEQLLGAMAARSVHPLLISTKFMPVPWTNLLVGGGLRAGRAAVLESLRNSNSRLGVGSVDVYSIHAPLPYIGGRHAIYEALADAYQLGLCRAVGVVNFNSRQLRDAHAICTRLGLPLVSNQIKYSLFNLERELDGTIETCHELGVTPIAHTPLANGFIASRYAKIFTAQPDRASLQGLLTRSRRLGRVEPRQLLTLQPAYQALHEVANNAPRRMPARTETQAALQFVMSKGCMPIPGVSNAEQATELLRTLDWQLDLDEVFQLNQAALALHVRRVDMPWLRRL